MLLYGFSRWVSDQVPLIFKVHCLLVVNFNLGFVTLFMQTNKRLGFGLKTAYTAVVYLDRFFLHRIIDVRKILHRFPLFFLCCCFLKLYFILIFSSQRGKAWAVRLLSIACLSLAAKMEENKVITLTDFQFEDYLFKCDAIQRMELLVLATLQWRMIVITPFAYLSYFASKLHEHSINELIKRAIGFIFSSIRGQNLKLFEIVLN